MEKERIEELERKMQEELERERADELKEKPTTDEGDERKEDTSVDKAEQNLISFDSEDFSQKSESTYPPSPNVYEPTESLIDIVYDDFSVKKPLIDVEFDDFSVKPRIRGSQTKVETTPVARNWAFDLLDTKTDEQEALVPLDVTPQKNEVVLEQVEKPVSLVEEEVEEKGRPEEAQLISLETEVEVEDEEKEEEVKTKEDGGDEEQQEEEQQEAQVNSYCTDDGDKDTDVLIDSEQEQQDGSCDQTTETESSNPDQLSDSAVEDVDAAVFHREPELAPFPETFAPLLDTTAQRSRAVLGKKRARTHLPRSIGAGSDQTEKLDWRAQDSTDLDEKEESSDSEEEQPKPKIASSPPTITQRVPIFPGLKHADLLAQIKKRTCGGETGGGGRGGGEAEEEKPRVDRESRAEEAAPAPTPLPRSPRTAANLAGAARVLPPLLGNEGGAASSPAWLKELKSKKRMSQHDINI
ncbi:uncharacterized protein KIAA1671 homolog [Mugil cephalus]|uniref:uncharacterized protein KIAA1671 homolog n=1 Tax=Mugil cephalus TaxID=48193 RepID=UPI001FB768EE|nr:uncharacterized protein KIAA1671 homolog [Mugil cephalus]